MAQQVGYSWILAHYGIQMAQDLRVTVSTGVARAITKRDGVERRTVPESMWPGERPSDHLTFALRYEGVNLELLARLFAIAPQDEWAAWIRSEPLGQYARRIGFLFEWMTGETIDVPALTSGNYIDLLDPEAYVVCPLPENVSRWRVRNNLLGTREYCPTIELTAEVRQAQDFSIRAKLEELQVEFGEDVLIRSANWLTLKESRASFAIEHEENKADRIHRFASVIQRMTGELRDPLSKEALTELQGEILGPALVKGIRRSPVFVGERGQLEATIIHYIAPSPDDLDGLMHGLAQTWERTQGTSAIVRAGLLSFGFVYIHPMADGNGRISRFLINDILRRDEVLPKPYILPISAVLQKKGLKPLSYDDALECYSRPLMRRYNGKWRHLKERVYPDGIESDFYFDEYPDAMNAWRYPNFTRQVAFMGHVIAETLDQEMRLEARIIQGFIAAREDIKQIIEAPNLVLDQIIASVRETKGRISNKMKGRFKQLADPAIERGIVEAVKKAFPKDFPPQEPEPEFGPR